MKKDEANYTTEIAKSAAEDIDNKIEIATQTLDRNIGFVTNCDNKTSIVLAAFGVLLAIILTNEGLNAILNIVRTCISTISCCKIIYLVCFAISVLLIIGGMLCLGSVLIANTSEKALGRKKATSLIFFAGIKECGAYPSFEQKFQVMTKEDFLNDLIEQIYINADIATRKYAKYNKGLFLTIIGFILFIVLLIVGIIVY